MNRTEERKIIETIDKLTDLICHNNYKWCDDCPLHISSSDGEFTDCSALRLINTFNKNIRMED